MLVTARTRTDGQWTDWFELHTMVDGGTEPSPNGRFGTVPYWAGDSDGVQVRVDAVGDADPTDVRADLIEPGTSDADAADRRRLERLDRLGRHRPSRPS